MFQRRCAAALALVLISAANVWGDIYRWDTGEVIAGTEGMSPRPLLWLSGKHLEYADFSRANLTDADFGWATLTGANFNGADLRGAAGFFPTVTDDTRNLAWPSGDVNGLDLTGEGTVLTVRDNEVPVSVSDNFLMNDDSLLQLLSQQYYT